MTFSRDLRICDDEVVKTDDPALMRVEVEKTRRAWAIGRSSGLFHVPQVLGYDDDTGVARFQKLHGIEPVMGLAGMTEHLEVFHKVGRCLAVIHAELALPAEWVVPLPAAVPAAEGPQAFLHGDFNCSNVMLAADGEVAILDWRMTARFGERATYGTRYFDVGWFLNFLLGTPVHERLFYRPLERSARAFLDGYFTASGPICGMAEFARFMAAFCQCNEKRRAGELRWPSRLATGPSNLRLRAFARSLCP
jgi:aminoglycoside phosphotransferase (APT) family kinase protein